MPTDLPGPDDNKAEPLAEEGRAIVWPLGCLAFVVLAFVIFFIYQAVLLAAQLAFGIELPNPYRWLK
jgi:hypothetical protein